MRDELAEFSRLWNGERYFEAHEVLEERWHRTGDPQERALIQCAAALLHLQRGNLAGAAKLLRAAAQPIGELAAREHAAAALAAWVGAAARSTALDAPGLLKRRPPLHLHAREREPGSLNPNTEGDAHHA
ncbi:DUF309 domain-containing protein [bacterium]|nr:MAG: DUF309 domain-containing protein [bacterium]